MTIFLQTQFDSGFIISKYPFKNNEPTDLSETWGPGVLGQGQVLGFFLISKVSTDAHYSESDTSLLQPFPFTYHI